MEKKWGTVIPADLKRLFGSGIYMPAGHERVKGQKWGSILSDIAQLKKLNHFDMKLCIRFDIARE
jgi:hypothetical protein